MKHFKVEDIPDDADYGYALQVDHITQLNFMTFIVIFR